MHQVGDLFELNIKLRCQKVKVTWVTLFDEDWLKCQDDELRMSGTSQPTPPHLPTSPRRIRIA
jgi:hypothetical protein